MICSVCLTVKPVGEPDAGNPHVRFDERGWETERCRMAQATAPILDSTDLVINFKMAKALGLDVPLHARLSLSGQPYGFAAG